MRNLLLVGIVLCLIVSCEENNNPVPVENPVHDPDYFPLAVGNYWIYQNFEFVDSSGAEILTDKLDSMVITRDTLINDHLYYVLEGTNYPFNSSGWEVIGMYRDSAGYIVNQKGRIILSGNNFTDTLATTTMIFEEIPIYTITTRMEEVPYKIRVPLGEFDVVNCRGTVFGLKLPEGVKNPRYLDNYYSDGIGKILQSNFYYLNETYRLEKRLMRYRVANPDKR